MSRGIIYYNVGKKMAVRLAVSIHSLRKIYDDEICILSEGDESHAFCELIASKYNCRMKRTVFNGTVGKNTTYLNACLVGQHTPFDTTVWLDSDTTAHRPFPELFAAAEENEFAIAQFSTWKTLKENGGATKITGRIEAWRGILPDEWLDRAFAFGCAINCGVFAFHKRSALVRDWWGLAIKGQPNFIPDETCCQIMLAQPEYKNQIMPQEFNCSCKYSDPKADGVRVVHYHGRKHCRFQAVEPLFNSDIWYKEFEEIRHWGMVRNHIQFDHQLTENIGAYDAWKS
jgi:hypothetical protein